MPTRADLVPLHAAVAPVRARHRGLLRELRTWALANGHAIDGDVAALVLAAAETQGDGDALGRWTRPRVYDTLWAGLTNWCSLHSCLHPDGEPETMWVYLHFVAATGRLGAGSDALAHLLEPLQCYGGLDADGRRRGPGSARPDFPCQCQLDVVEPTRPGLSRVRTCDGSIIELWRPSPAEPVLAAWYGALAAFSRAVRAGGHGWAVPLEDFYVVGRVDAAGRSPEVWMYGNRETTGDLFVGVDGQAYWLRPDGRRRAGYRFSPLSPVAAAAGAGVLRSSSRRRRWEWDDDDVPLVDEPSRPGLRVLVTPPA